MRQLRYQDKCPDCHEPVGHIHLSGCDIEQCSVCGNQLLTCGCAKHDPRKGRWTGYTPGTIEAAAAGLFHKEDEHGRDVPCDAADPEAKPDLNRWYDRLAHERRKGPP